MTNFFALLVSLSLSFVAAAIGAAASIDAADFYQALDRPAWAPPASVFGPVWTVLYVLMAVAVWWVWKTHQWRHGVLPYGLYGAQLVANALWSWLFFEWKLGLWAFVDAVVLTVLVASTLVSFAQHRRVAAVLMVPYLLWVGFASALTCSVWLRNPTLL